MPTYGEIFSYSFAKLKQNFFFLLGAILIYFGVSVVSGIIQGVFSYQLGILASLIGIAFSLLNVLIELGFLKILLNIVDGKKSDYSELYKNYPLFVSFFLAGLLMGILVLGGLILLVIPGIYVAIKLQFTPILVADKGLGPVGAVKASWELTKGKWFKLFVFDLLVAGINILGAIALGVGLLFTIPLSAIAFVYLYRKL